LPNIFLVAYGFRGASLVCSVPDLLGQLKAAVVVAQLRLLEGLGLVKLHPVEGAHLVSVRVLLSAPGGAVPVLPVGRVARGELVRLHGSHLQHLRLLEADICVAGPPVVAGLALRSVVASSEGRGVVVDGVDVRARAHLSFGAESSRSCVQLVVGLWDQISVETRGSKAVRGQIQRLVENLTRLLSLGLAKVVVVHSNTGHVTLIARNDIGLLADGSLHERISSNLVIYYLGRHVVGGGPVEIVVAPLEELVLREDLTDFVVAHCKLVL